MELTGKAMSEAWPNISPHLYIVDLSLAVGLGLYKLVFSICAKDGPLESLYYAAERCKEALDAGDFQASEAAQAC